MKMTEFELDKQYRLPRWDEGVYLYFDTLQLLTFSESTKGNSFPVSYEELQSDEWEEFEVKFTYQELEEKIKELEEQIARYDALIDAMFKVI